MCIFCRNSYESYQKSRKFCSKKCHIESIKSKKKVKAEKPKKEQQQKLCAHCGNKFKCWKTSNKVTCSAECSTSLRLSKHTKKICLFCGIEYQTSPSKNQKYCSYRCHLDNGGAFKAGMASAKAKMKYGPKRDANHSEIFDVLKKKCAVYDVSTSGMGIPDGLAWINGAWHLFDIKNPKTGYGKRGLNPIQKKWLSQAQGGPIYLLYTTEDAENFALGKFEGLKFELPAT